jgi:type VI secretion system protein ImpF
MPASQRTVVTASLFDRLTDYEPRVTREVPPTDSEQRELFKAGVARDLADLLNTIRRSDEIPESYSRTRASILAYGMPDFTAAPMDEEAIRSTIESVVRTFEPRLSQIEVAFDVIRQRQPADLVFSFSFRIVAILRTDFGSEPVIYDAVLPKQRPRFQVTVGR